ncbi:MAG: type II secretion system F family protein [Planctomycetes bacterium]|nr:type II secretion system F family protein [Planctomycetota bacterium]
MANFTYKAKNAQGETVSGSLAGSSEEDIVQKLRKQHLVVLKVKAAGKKGSIHGAKGGRKAKPGAKKGELELFTRQLATMISAGIPLLECLEILAEQAQTPNFRNCITYVVEDIRGGNDLSAAMSKYPKVFTEIYVSMVRAGEASGQLDEILSRLADYLEASAALKREIKAAMTYPVVSLVMVVGITAFLMIVIVPKFKEIFDGLEIELPAFTSIVMNTSLWMKNNVSVMMLLMVGSVVGFNIFKKTPMGRSFTDHVVVKIPVFGPLFQKVAISRFARTFSTLIKSGVPILGSLEIVADTAGNTIVSKAVRQSLENVRQGETLAEPLSHHWIFPPMVTRMIGIGEKSGALEHLLSKISDFYDQQVEAEVKSLTSLIEPIMIAVMGIMVGSIVMAVFLPIMKLQASLTPGG